jgi:cysteine synthase A
MNVYNGLIDAIGNTPLIKLSKLSDLVGSEIWGKAEFLNPGGSVKDRAAKGIIEDAERRGLLLPGGTIVEGTAGNTGIGLTLVGNAKGYKSIIIIPNNQSQEKIDSLRAMGAEVRLVDPAPYSNPNNYNHIAKRTAEEIPGAFWANQFDNTANREAHESSTGPEIWRQTEGKVTAFVASVGTGGTLAGTAAGLRRFSDSVDIVCADPMGAAMWSWFTQGHTDIDDGDSVAEGIGQGRVTTNIEGLCVDAAYRIPDSVAIEMLYFLLREEGLFLSLSSAINVCGAALHALKQGSGQKIVTILCDSGTRYLSRLYNPDWLAGEGLVVTGQQEVLLEGLRGL